MENLKPIADILRAIADSAGPDVAGVVKGLPDVAVVGGAGGATLLFLIILFSLLGAIAGGGKKKRRREAEEAAAEASAQRRAAAREAAAPPRAAAQTRSDPIQSMERDAAANADRVRRESEELRQILVAERLRASRDKAPFAETVPTEALRLLAEGLVDAREPARAAARRRLAAREFDAARADLRRHAEGTNSAAAWRDLGALEAFSDLQQTISAFQQACRIDNNDFVSLITLGRLYRGTNRSSDAREIAKAAVASARNDREKAIALDEFGDCSVALKDTEAAQQAYAESLRLVSAIAEKTPGDAERVRDVAVGHFKLATLNGPDTREHLAQALATFEKIQRSGRLDPEDAAVMEQLRQALAQDGAKGGEA